MKQILVTVGLVLALGAAPLRADGRIRGLTPPARQGVVVPFELLKTKHITVKIKLNGKGPFRVIFDTGAPVNLINNRAARESGMVSAQERPSFFSLFSSMGEVKIRTLEVGGLKVKDTSAVVMDHPTLELLGEKLGRIDGIIGYPFFARYRMTLDYQAKQLTFTPNGYVPQDAMEAMSNALTAIAEDKPAPPQILVPAAQWGLVLEKPKGEEEAGVILHQVLKDSAAAAAGLKAGDRMLTLDGRWTDSLADAYTAAAHVPPGSAVKVVVRRDGKEMELTVKPRAGM